MKMRIAVFSDSINIPPKEGVNVHTYDLLRTLAARSDCTPILVVCDRGWLEHDVLRTQTFDTILLPEKFFYDVNYIAKLVITHGFDIVQSYMTYFGSAVLGPAAYQANIPCVAELHDLEESVVSVYFSHDELADATRQHVAFQKQAAKYASVVRIMSEYDYSIIKETWNDFNTQRYVCIPVSRPTVKTDHHISPSLITYIGNMSYTPNAQGAEIIKNKI
ncbi:glycosyltransferase, partial [Microbacteriaceae bacterium]|nr:glycosyltransferase [Candidatus Saccharibacteria bacterium]